MTTLRLRWPDLPHSSKNSRQIIRVAGKPRSVLSADAKRDKQSLRTLALLEWARHIPRGEEAVFAGRDVAVTIRASKREKWIDLEVTDLGPRRLSLGQRRDLHGMVETIMDAIEGVAFTDDAQVSRLDMEWIDEGLDR